MNPSVNPGGNRAAPSLVSAIRGPVLLIVVGSLFAIDYFGPVSISRTWPVLLITLGLFKLLERVGTKNA